MYNNRKYNQKYNQDRRYNNRGNNRGNKVREEQNSATDKTKEHLRNYVDGFFGVRNGKKFTPIENINYTIETLSYMTPRVRADEITNLIIKTMGNNSEIAQISEIKGAYDHQLQSQVSGSIKDETIIIDATAGIGGNVLSFLDSNKFSKVIAYEINPLRRSMLMKNINEYGYDSCKYEIIDSDEGFKGISPELSNTILYFDPPWLPSNIKGDESTPSQYLLSEIKIGDLTLEQWLDKCRNCQLIVMRVPPGYKLKNVDNFKISYVEIKKSLLILASPLGL